MFYELKKLGHCDWNDALDEYLQYKKDNVSCTFNNWYTVKTKTKSINEKIKRVNYNKSSKYTTSQPVKKSSINELKNITKAEEEILNMLDNLNLDFKISKTPVDESYSEKVVKEAEQLARRAHAGQIRANGDPYIKHIEEVVSIIKSNENSNTAEALIVGWLHDVVSTTSYTREYLLEQRWMTNRMMISIDCLQIGFFESYEEYVMRLQENELSWVVKLAKLMAIIEADPTLEERLEIESICQFLEEDDLL